MILKSDWVDEVWSNVPHERALFTEAELEGRRAGVQLGAAQQNRASKVTATVTKSLIVETSATRKFALL